MILAADRDGCLPEVLIITAALSIQDPRERPADARDAADAQHRRFAVPGSDFLAFLALWEYLNDRQRELSGSAFRRLCRREYLHYLRVREWQDVHAQLREAARDVGASVGSGRAASAAAAGTAPLRGDEPAARWQGEIADRVHRALLAGLLSQVGMQDTRDKPTRTGGARPPRPRSQRGPAEFIGARGARFAIFPDSALARKPPQWVMAAELVETSRLWARITAHIEPEWAEPLAAHLVKRSYSEPHWDSRAGAVLALEKVTLYGLPIVVDRKVSYGRVDPVAARGLFITGALVEGDWDTRHEFFRRNQQLRVQAATLEDRARRRGLIADDTVLFDFYDQRIPAEVTSAGHFDSWWKKARAADPDLLTLTPADLAGPAADEIRAEDYPGSWDALPLSYEFAPGEPGDGVTVDIPLASLSQVSEEQFGWQVPGRREELVTELIRSLPKELRRAFVPAPDTARAVLAGLGEPRGNLLDALSTELDRMTGVRVARDAWDESRLPAHLRMTFRVTDSGRELATGKDLAELRQLMAPRLQELISQAAGGLTRTGLKDWTIGTLPHMIRNGTVTGYPALVEAGNAVDVRVLPSRAEADQAMARGTRRLVLLQVPSGVRSIADRLPNQRKLAMTRSPYPGIIALLDDCVAAAADQVIADAGGPAWDAEGFARLVAQARPALPLATAQAVDVVALVLEAAQDVQTRLHASGQGSGVVAAAVADARADARAQYDALIHPGFVSETGLARLPDLVRYLRAITRRLDTMAQSPGRDAERQAAVQRVTDAWHQAVAGLPDWRRGRPEVQSVRWLIEELRVSLFAQLLGTPVPVSEKRILTAIGQLMDSPG
jgi:ATP-dependent helicase HrpA